MDAEASLFEASETMGSFLGSTPLLRDSWRLCSAANAALTPPAGPGFVLDRVGPVGYIAFSGIVAVSGSDLYLEELVPLVGGELFSALDCGGAGTDEEEEEEPVMVHKGLLHLFLNVYTSSEFQTQVKAITEKSKLIVLTGHSIGGATASLMAMAMLCCLEASPSPPATQILCITFGSPLLGNRSLSRALLRQRWAGNFCHVVSKHDIVPRLLFAPLATFNTQLHCLLQYWQLSMASPHFGHLAVQIQDEDKTRLLQIVLAYTESQAIASEMPGELAFWPYGSYLFCSEDGAVCVDNAVAVVRLLHLMMATATPDSCVQDHLKYGEYTERVSWQMLQNKSVVLEGLPESSYELGMAMALQSMGLGNQGSISESAMECLKMEKQMGRTPNLNSDKLAICLSKITPCRAQIEWYKASCDKSDDQMGYYDSFKRRQASKRDAQVNMFRLKLAQFWDDVISMIDNNKLPHDFHKRPKWVNASHFYQLLVEPLDIADYYRSSMNLSKGHYMKHGRERRHQIIDKWWRGRKVGAEENQKRSKFAGLTQDACFWAKLEEARELLEKVRREKSSAIELWKDIEAFERYSRELIESKEVSKDVLARNSSYSLWVEELGDVRSQLEQFTPQVTGFLDRKVVP